MELECLMDIVDLKGQVIAEHHHRQFLQRAFTNPGIRPLPNGIQQVIDVPTDALVDLPPMVIADRSASTPRQPNTGPRSPARTGPNTSEYVSSLT
ncbi:hypothetical protein [Streptomyces lunalinharesii]|uniref:hypothetical protein n=1 Tax=Streptomyces lunalinharesii TaxID=333384 RepID=UPI0031E3257D